MLDINSSIFERVKDKGEQLSPKQVQLAKHLIGNYKTAAFQTISQLAREADVSEATVVRLATTLGYSGFPDMLDELQKIVQHELHAFETIRHTYKGEQLKQLNLIETVVNNEQRNITNLLDSIRVRDIEEVVEIICRADRVVIVGSYSSSYLAQFFGYNLGKVKENVTTVSRDSTDFHNILLSCGGNSAVIIFSFPRYPKKMQLFGELFRKKGITVVGITDSYLSPLKAVSNHLLVIPQQYTSFSDPGCAVMLLLQAIIMEYISRDPDKTEECLQLFDEYVEHVRFL